MISTSNTRDPVLETRDHLIEKWCPRLGQLAHFVSRVVLALGIGIPVGLATGVTTYLVTRDPEMSLMSGGNACIGAGLSSRLLGSDEGRSLELVANQIPLIRKIVVGQKSAIASLLTIGTESTLVGAFEISRHQEIKTSKLGPFVASVIALPMGIMAGLALKQLLIDKNLNQVDQRSVRRED